MKIDRREGSQQRRIITAMIVDRTVLSRIAPRWKKEGLFPDDWCNIIGGWCVKHFNKYGTAPGRDIQSRFERWAQNGAADKATTKLLSNFLSGLSDEYEELAKDSNSEYIIDLAAEYFNQVELRRLAEKIQDDLEEGRLESAQSVVDKFHRIEMGVGAGVDILHDREALIQAVEEHGDPLLSFPGPLGEFFGDTLERDGFVALMAPEKRGKTFWLMEFVWQSILQRRKVAYFQTGDMSQDQIMRRLMTRALGKPLRAKKYQYPVKIQRAPDSMFASVDLEERVSKRDRDWQDVWARFEEIRKTKVRSGISTAKLSCHPNMSLTVDGLDAILDNWERQYEWIPDIIVVDYADIMAKDPGLDPREGINMIWAKLRALSQSRHCLVITATQADAGSYSKVVINLTNFSEDKRKYSHVTAMAAINSSPDEKESGLQRLTWLVRREAMTGRSVHVAGCFEIANPAIRSCW